VDAEQERSESGQPIWRHEPREKPFEFAIGDEESIEAIDKHITTHIGPVDFVYHEIISDLVHIDVHIVNPTPARNYYTLITSGMSDRPMTVPEGADEYRYAELMICLPPTWSLSDEELKDETNYWPVGLLKILARLPHEYDTWLGPGHTMPNGDPPEPYATNTALCCALLLTPMTTPDAFHRLEISAEKVINFYAVFPLYKKEMDLKLAKGAEGLFEGFEKHQVTEVLNVNRPNVARSRIWPF
jgi:hypothetical protein